MTTYYVYNYIFINKITNKTDIKHYLNKYLLLHVWFKLHQLNFTIGYKIYKIFDIYVHKAIYTI